MAQPRKQLVSIDDTAFYNITTRCVRRSFLCGYDKFNGKSYEHRRSWIEQRIRLLSSIFAIDICAYAVMSNHLHLVIKLNPKEAAQWSAKEVLERWCCLFKGSPIVQRYIAGEELSKVEREAVSDCIECYQKRLQNLSWFMKCLNEPIARQANKEDNCTGHFWESRFKSQALLTETALLSAMAYVDLNPVRACMADTPETSEYTSIKERINPIFDLGEAVKQQTVLQSIRQFDLPVKPLLHFEGSLKNTEQSGIIFGLADYIELVDWTGSS
ncbi:transposase [Marinagarivorans algicola]|uniref:transposase n=1 Tax=Marinagarivorans algicola TaxID=1513270 RepID=UPI003736E098